MGLKLDSCEPHGKTNAIGWGIVGNYHSSVDSVADNGGPIEVAAKKIRHSGAKQIAVIDYGDGQVARLREAADSSVIIESIIWDKACYEKWLGIREDSQEARAEWAAEMSTFNEPEKEEKPPWE